MNYNGTCHLNMKFSGGEKDGHASTDFSQVLNMDGRGMVPDLIFGFILLHLHLL